MSSTFLSSCVYICLMWCRYLLCGLSVTEESSSTVTLDTMTRPGAGIATTSPAHSPAKSAKTSGSRAIQVGCLQCTWHIYIPMGVRLMAVKVVNVIEKGEFLINYHGKEFSLFSWYGSILSFPHVSWIKKLSFCWDYVASSNPNLYIAAKTKITAEEL